MFDRATFVHLCSSMANQVTLVALLIYSFVGLVASIRRKVNHVANSFLFGFNCSICFTSGKLHRVGRSRGCHGRISS